MDNEHMIKLIDKYLAGKCSPEESDLIEHWYSSLDYKDAIFCEGNQGEMITSITDSLAAVRSKIGLKGDIETSPSINRKLLPWKWLVAASIILLCSITTLYVSQRSTETYSIIQTKTGQVKKLRLPDGTQVWLNAGSTLKYSSAFNQKDRRVWLNGEAFFDVAHNKKKPFDIYSGEVKTHVLGTAFSVSAYAGSSMQTVTVVRGKVQVSNGLETLAFLLPNQELEYSLTNQKPSVIHVDAAEMTSWRNGKLSFINMPMQDIAVHLQNLYGLRFIFKNQEFKNIRFTASYNKETGLKGLLEVMSEVSHVNYHFDERTNTVTYFDN